jgi:hypothetical protein
VTGTAPPVAMVPLVIGVTSHRNLPAREIEPIRERVRDFFARLQRDFPQLPLVVLSALAEGGDQLVAHEALAAGARLIAPLPLPLELYVEDFTGTAARVDFDALCGKAEVMQLPLLRGQTRFAVKSRGAARDRQYAQAGVYIASHCHILLTIWDGKASDRLGGTAQIVRYHLSGALPGLMDRRRGARHVFGGSDERLAYQIVCSRDEAGGAPAADLQPLQLLWRTAHHADTAADGMPARFRLGFTRMAEFNTECAGHASAIERATPADRDTVAATAAIDQLFGAADWLAVHFCQRVLLAMRTTYTLAGLMGIAFMCYSDLPAQDYMIFVFLLLFALGALIALLAQRRGWHRKYLDYRALAEGLRVQSYWRRAGISVTGDPEFAHDNFLQKQDVELGWIRNVMRAAGLPAPGQAAALARAATPAPGELAGVIAEWIGEPGLSGQLGYYERKAAERTRLHHRTEQIGLISLRGGIAISVFLAVFVFKLSQDAKTTLVAIMAVLSITAAVREAYAYRKADKELIKQYRFMQRIFASAYAALHATRDPLEQRDILRALGEAALAEHAEWTLMHRERQVEPGKL